MSPNTARKKKKKKSLLEGGLTLTVRRGERDLVGDPLLALSAEILGLVVHREKRIFVGRKKEGAEY